MFTYVTGSTKTTTKLRWQGLSTHSSTSVGTISFSPHAWMECENEFNQPKFSCTFYEFHHHSACTIEGPILTVLVKRGPVLFWLNLEKYQWNEWFLWFQDLYLQKACILCWLAQHERSNAHDFIPPWFGVASYLTKKAYIYIYM